MNFSVDVDWKPSLKWLDQIKSGAGDARPLWVAMIPRVREFVAEEFSGNNPNKWSALTPKYRHWKAMRGFPHWIGVLHGNLRQGAGPGAKIVIHPKYFKWELDQSKTVNARGTNYAPFFNFGTSKMPARPVFKSTVLRVNNFLRKDINDLYGGSRMAFTFKWLEKAIEPYRRR